MPTDLPPVWTADETQELAAVVADLVERVAALEGGGVPPVPPSSDGVDLVVTFVPPPVLTQGAPVTLAATVWNRGNVDVPPSAADKVIGVGFLCDDVAVAWVSTGAGLRAGTTVVLDTSTAPMHSDTWRPADAGEHELSAFVDDLDRIPEYDEANNRVDVDVVIAEGSSSGGGGGGAGGTRARPFAENSLWNTPKTGLTFADGADWLLSSSAYGVNNGPYSHPITWSTDTDPVHQIATPASWGWPAQTLQVHMRDDAQPASGTDGHLCLMNADGRLVDMWILRSTGSRSWRCESYAMHDWMTGPGWGQASPFLAAGITASGAPTVAGTITADDVDAGRIEHALCMAFEWGAQGGAGTCWTGQLWPAIASDVNGGPGPLAEGALLVAQGNAPAGLNASEAALFDACTTYGVYVVDKLDGAAMFYGDRSDKVGGAFRFDQVTAIGRTLRMAVTW